MVICEAQFSSSGCFCLGHEDEELCWIVRCQTQVLLGVFLLEHSLRIHGFRLTWPCLIIEVLATRAKFLEPSDYCIVISSFWLPLCHYGTAQTRKASVPELDWCPSPVQLSNNTCHEKNALLVSTPTTMILLTVGTYHSLNCFSHRHDAKSHIPKYCKTFDAPKSK